MANGEESNGRPLRWVINLMALSVTLIWSVSFVVDMVATSYDPPASINAVMILVVGAVFGGSVIRRGGGTE